MYHNSWEYLDHAIPIGIGDDANFTHQSPFFQNSNLISCDYFPLESFVTDTNFVILGKLNGSWAIGSIMILSSESLLYRHQIWSWRAKFVDFDNT